MIRRALWRLERAVLWAGTGIAAPAQPKLGAGVVRWQVGPVEAFVLEPPTGELPRGAVVFAHGNGELIDDWLEHFDRHPDGGRPYGDRALVVVLVEYRGYGRSGGVPSEARVVADFLCVLERLEREYSVPAGRVILHGRSLGGGVVLGVARALADERPSVGLCALVLESTFTSVRDVAKRLLLPALLPSVLYESPFESLAALSGLDCPTLVMHGTRDQVVPFRHGQRLAEAARDGELVTWGCGHNDIPRDEAHYWGPIGRLLDRVLPG